MLVQARLGSADKPCPVVYPEAELISQGILPNEIVLRMGSMKEVAWAKVGATLLLCDYLGGKALLGGACP